MPRTTSRSPWNTGAKHSSTITWEGRNMRTSLRQSYRHQGAVRRRFGHERFRSKRESRYSEAISRARKQIMHWLGRLIVGKTITELGKGRLGAGNEKESNHGLRRQPIGSKPGCCWRRNWRGLPWEAFKHQKEAPCLQGSSEACTCTLVQLPSPVGA